MPKYSGIQFKHLMEVNAFTVFTLISVLLDAQFHSHTWATVVASLRVKQVRQK